MYETQILPTLTLLNIGKKCKQPKFSSSRARHQYACVLEAVKMRESRFLEGKIEIERDEDEKFSTEIFRYRVNVIDDSPAFENFVAARFSETNTFWHEVR